MVASGIWTVGIAVAGVAVLGFLAKFLRVGNCTGPCERRRAGYDGGGSDAGLFALSSSERAQADDAHHSHHPGHHGHHPGSGSDGHHHAEATFDSSGDCGCDSGSGGDGGGGGD